MSTPEHQNIKTEIQRLLDQADEDTRKVIELVTRLERQKLYQRNPSKAEMTREIAAIVRKVIS
jgi:DNA-binding protein H-NS